ncbi:hypothetical protein DL93DRAFT_2088325, partial [Clavulina sp. PMI_390]
VWRSVTFGITKLFVSPDWLNWSDLDIGIWTSKSGTRLLDGHLTDSRSQHRNKRRESDALIKAVQALTPFIHRLRSLKLDIVRSTDFITVQQLLSGHDAVAFPMLTTLVVRSTRLDDPANTICIKLAILPLLNSLYVPNVSLRTEGRPSCSINKLGWRVFDSHDLRALTTVLAQQRVPSLYLTIFAHETMQIRSPFESLENSLAWSSLLSLRLHGVSGLDNEHAGSLFSQLQAPNLRRLELVEIDQAIFSILVAELVC